MENNGNVGGLLRSWGLGHMIHQFEGVGVFELCQLFCLSEITISQLFRNECEEYSFRVKWVKFCNEFGQRRGITNRRNLEISKLRVITSEGLRQILMGNFTTMGIIKQHENTHNVSVVARDKIIEVIVEALLMLHPGWEIKYQKIIAQSLIKLFPTLQMNLLYTDPMRRNDSSTGLYIPAGGSLPAQFKKALQNNRRRTR